MLTGKHILLGVTGGIAGYKSAMLVRELVRGGAEVQVVMTRSAAQFVAPLTFSTLSRREAIIDMFPNPSGQAPGQWTAHIDLGMWADVMLIAPATANTLAKIASGMADNFLTTLVLALRCPLVVAPAMDVDMWLHEATQRNIGVLREMGARVIEPETGELASGLSGPGRLPEPAAIVAYLEHFLEGAHQDLRGKRVLVTAGPTHEPIDPVRYLGNSSSGKMGFALAAAAMQRGAQVTLISGPVQLHTPRQVRRIDVTTAEEMMEAARREFPSSDLVLMAAAVADFAPVAVSASKIKREAVTGETVTLELRKNPDILQMLGKEKQHQVLVGFALETDNGLEHARRKLEAKHLDAIALNNPREEGAGFGVDTNVVTLLMADGTVERLPKMAKLDVADRILDRVTPLLG